MVDELLKGAAARVLRDLDGPLQPSPPLVKFAALPAPSAPAPNVSYPSAPPTERERRGSAASMTLDSIRALSSESIPAPARQPSSESLVHSRQASSGVRLARRAQRSPDPAPRPQRLRAGDDDLSATASGFRGAPSGAWSRALATAPRGTLRARTRTDSEDTPRVRTSRSHRRTASRPDKPSARSNSQGRRPVPATKAPRSAR